MAGTNQSFVVPGLSASTTYYFAMKTADDVLNWSGISNSPSGTTSAPPPASETESFGYDFLDRLTSVSGAYTESYTYNQIGNMLTMNGVAYSYGDASHKHAVTAVGAAGYSYDSNGNMTTRGTQTLTWDAENRVVSATGGASFIYDGDGNRVKKTENGQTILYINKYYEKNLTTGEATTYYYLGDKLVAKRTGTTLQYIHEDHLNGTSVVSSSTGAFVSSILYTPYGTTRSGDVPTDKKFTGQRLDGTGLYYYGSRYYDAVIGRFVSPDTVVPDAGNPQTLNRYAYVLNNPLRYGDPSGRMYVPEYDCDPNNFLEMWTMASLSSQIEDAYREVVGNPDVPAWIQDYMQTIHNSDRVAYVGFADQQGESVGLSAMSISIAGVNVRTPDRIVLDYSTLGNSRNMAPMLAHESYHIFEGNPSATIAEEYAAHTAQFLVDSALGNANAFPSYWFSTPGGLGSDQFLGGIQYQLGRGRGNSANVYSVMPLTQSGMNRHHLVAEGTAAFGASRSWAAIFGYLSYLVQPLTVSGIPWK